MLVIREAKPEDAPRILEIYAYYVTYTAVTFEWEVPSLAAFRKRMENTMQHYPYLVIEEDGIIQGYSYAGPFVGRKAYDWACEMTIYLDHQARGRGLGHMLYDAMEQALKQMGILNLYACIGLPEKEDAYLTYASPRFHARMGYEEVGRFHDCGYKFNRWYHMIWMEKIIGVHKEQQPSVKRYQDIKNSPENRTAD